MPAPIASLVERSGSKPGAPALIGGAKTVTYASLLRGVQSGAAWLHRSGVRAGDTVAYTLDLEPAHYVRQVELFYAIAYLGAAILPFYPEAAAAPRGQLVARFDARWLISAHALETGGASIRLDPSEYDAARGTWPEIAAPRGDDPARPFLYEFSSGTTGTPKVVLFSGDQYAAIRLTLARAYGLRESDIMVAALRWPTKVGLRGLVRAHLLGAAYADEPFPDTRGDLARLVGEIGVTSVDSSPWQLRRLLASELPAGLRRPPLRVLGTAGAFIAPREIQAARETLTANFHVTYGNTEIGMIAHLHPEDPVDAGPRLVPGMDGEAVDDYGRPLPAGQPGRLRFRAPWLPEGYAGNVEGTVESFRDGWFLSSDFGSIDAAGRVALRGRTDDAINFGGAKILPRDVECELEAHPDIADAALVGMPDAMAGEIPVAFVVVRRPVSVAALHSFLAGRLDHWQVPAAIVTTPEIPRNPEGKILRERLRAAYADPGTSRNQEN